MGSLVLWLCTRRSTFYRLYICRSLSLCLSVYWNPSLRLCCSFSLWCHFMTNILLCFSSCTIWRYFSSVLLLPICLLLRCCWIRNGCRRRTWFHTQELLKECKAILDKIKRIEPIFAFILIVSSLFKKVLLLTPDLHHKFLFSHLRIANFTLHLLV